MTRTSQALPTLLSQLNCLVCWWTCANPAMRQVLMCTQEVCYAEVEPCPESCAAGERRCSLPQHEHHRSCSLAVPSIPLWWKWTHTGLTRWFVVALYDCLLLEDSCGCCCFSSRRLSDGLQCIWISSQVLWTLRARGGRCWSSSVDSLRLQNLSGRVWPAQQVESTWYV